MKILKYPHPSLFHKCKPLIKVDKEVKDVVAEMREFIYGGALGLAATQVGKPYNLFVTKYEELPVIINPVLYLYGGFYESIEGCLSIPNLELNILRHKKVKITGYDLEGNEIKMAVSKDIARVCQHEKDHLEGVLFINKAKQGQIEQMIGVLHGLLEEFDKNPLDKELWQKEIEQLEIERCLL